MELVHVNQTTSDVSHKTCVQQYEGEFHSSTASISTRCWSRPASWVGQLDWALSMIRTAVQQSTRWHCYSATNSDGQCIKLTKNSLGNDIPERDIGMRYSLQWVHSSPNDLYCVEWDVKPYSTQWVHHQSILLLLLRLTPPMEGFPWDDLRKISHWDQRMARVQNGEDIFPKSFQPPA